MNPIPDRAPATVAVDRNATSPPAPADPADPAGSAPRQRLPARWPAAVGVPLAACGLQWLLWDFLRPYVWFLFFPAAYFCAYLGGLRGGLISTAISALLVGYVFIPPRFSFRFENPSSWFSIAVFVGMGALFGVAHERLAKARRQSAEALALAERRTREAEAANRRSAQEIAARVRVEKDGERQAAELARREAHEREIERWTRLYAALSQINKAVVRVKSHEELAREVARVTVEFGGFKLAWIGRYDPRTHDVTPLGSAGAPRELLSEIRLAPTDDVPTSPCPCGPVLRDGRAYVINDLAAEPDTRGWKSAMLAAGIHAVAVFPIRLQGAVWGVLGVYAAETGVFQDKETALLEQAAMDIDYALENLANEASRLRAEESLRDSECRRALALDAANAGTWQWQLATNTNVWSDELWRLYGLDPGTCEPSYESWRRTVHPDDLPAVERGLGEAVRREAEIQLEWRVTRSNGHERWLMSRGRPLRDATGRVTDYIGVVMEITDRKRSEQLLARGLEAMVRLRKLAMTFARADDLPSALTEVVDAAIAISDADFGNVQLVDPATGELRIMAHRGFPRWWLDYWNSVAEGQGSCGTALQSAEQVVIEDVAESPIFQGTPGLDAQLKAGVRAVQSTPLVDRSGQVIGMISTHYRTPRRPDEHTLQMLNLLARQAADLIEQARAKEALRESESRLRLSVAAANIGLWDWDMKTNRVVYSPEWKRQIGYADEEIPDRFEEWQSRVHPDDLEPTLRELRAYLVNPRGPRKSEFRFRHKDGSYRWIFSLSDVTRDDGGTPVRMLGSHVDITERKQAEEAVREGEARLRFALETNRTGAWDLDLVNHTAHRSLEHDRVFGYSELLPSWTYERFLDHVLPEDRPAVDANFHAATAARSNWDFECRIRRVDGEVRWIGASGRHVVDASGQVRRMAGIVQDITAKKRAEEEILALNTELERRVQERTAQLQAVNQELETFSYSVSHDLRAPLRHIQGFVGILERELGDGLSERARHLIRTINEASRDMAVLIDDLLAFSRMGRQEMQQTVVPLDGLVREARRTVDSTTADRRIDWRIAPLPTVRGDPAMLRQVLANLLENAVKYSRPRDPAIIEVGTDGTKDGRIVLFVRDNGVGFDPRYAHKLFGVFQRLHAGGEFEGTGIGLASVRRILARHGGEVWAASQPDQGATFYFTLAPAGPNDPTHE